MNVNIVEDPTISLRLLSLWSEELSKWINSLPVQINVPSNFFKLNKRQKKKAIQKILSARLDKRFSLEPCVNVLNKPPKGSMVLDNHDTFLTNLKSIVSDKKVAAVFIDSLSVSRGTEPPSLNETTTLTIYTDGTKDIKKESN